MELNTFAKRLGWHVLGATAVLAACLAVGEWLVPGSVLPFFNLVDAILIFLVISVVFAAIQSRSS